MKLEEYNKKKNMESAQPPYFAQHPWLVICFGGELENQTFFNVQEDQYYMRRIPELKEKIIRAYADEWLLLESIYSSDCYLWNLISNEKIQLPPLPTECEILMCLLSAPPHDPKCQILFLIKETETENEDEDEDEDEDENDEDVDLDDENDEDEDEDEDDDDENDDDDDENDDENDEDVNPPTLYFCKPGYNEEFHKQEVQSIIGDWRLGIWTVFKRKFYILTCKTHALLCLDPDNDSGRIIVTLMANEFPIMFRGYLDMNRFENYIIQSSNDDMLLYVHLYFNGKGHVMPYHFQVLKFDFEKKMWIETESIGEIAIFVSYSTRTGTTCSTRGTNLNGESIYFTDGRYLYVYNLITHSISLSLPCPHVPKKNPYMHWLTLN